MIFLDANIIIYAFKPENSFILHLLHIEDEDVACSEIVRLEVMGFKGLSPQETSKLREFFQGLTIFPIDSKVIDEAIKIRRQKAIGAPDAIIAATALITNHKLWTSNVKDFGWIKNLNWHNPIGANY